MLTLTQNSIANFNRSQSELEEFAIFSILVAGKTAKTMISCLRNFLEDKPYRQRPFIYIQKNFSNVRELAGKFHHCGIGCYNGKARSVFELAHKPICLKTCNVATLEEVWGISHKTSRFFKTYSQKDFKGAVLDRHILKWLKDIGVVNVPKDTPKDKQYLRLEQIFLDHAEKIGISPVELDWKIWEKYSNGA
jgi:thermostable 8-oxoguanine DNA glycosylase